MKLKYSLIALCTLCSTSFASLNSFAEDGVIKQDDQRINQDRQDLKQDDQNVKDRA